jgi:HEAT repeat protein
MEDELLASMALGIGLLGQESSIAELGSALVNPRTSKLVQSYVASALGKIGNDEALKPLFRAWKRADPMVKGSIALAMGAYPDTPVVQFLEKEGLSDGEGQNQNFSAISLARIGSALPVDTVAYKRALVMLQDHAAKPARNPTLAQYSALGLAILGDDSMVPQFREMAASRKNKDTVRSCMALSVGLLGDQASLNDLRELLGNRGGDPKLRSYAALGLAFLGDSSQIPYLKEQYQAAAERNLRDVQRGCVFALGFLGDATNVDFLIKDVLIEAKDPTVRGAAAIALGIMREATAVDKLIEILESRSADVSVEDKAFAAAALGCLADKDPFPRLSRIFENCNYRLEYPQLVEVLSIL